MRYVVYGAGAVGGVLGGRLHDAGHDVVLVARGEHLRAIQRDGLGLVEPDGTRSLSVPAVADAREVDPSSPTTVLLAVKSHQTRTAVEDLVAAGMTTSPVVSLQNGVANERHLLRFFADVQGVCVMMPASHLEPGVVEQHSSPVPGILDIGRFPGGTDATTHSVAEAFRSAGFVSEPRTDVMAWKHRKLLGNLANAVGACCGESTGTAELRDRARSEGEQALAAAGVPVVSAEEDRARRGDLLGTGGGGGRAGGSSWQSLRRATGSIESDYLNGEIVLLGRLHGVPTPCNELLRRTAVRMARAGEQPGTVQASDLLASLGPVIPL
jgi:2-dehydropantoate 2-reductase